MAYQPLKSLATLNATLQISMASAERIFEIIDQKPKIIENLNNKDSFLNKNTSYNLKIEKSISVLKIHKIKFSKYKS